eukprot:NODE_5040_length_725_cov_58.816568_g4677_i0.p2 GENE.NODE_5040_length_725_cov_58.816568_g4677_i0~~NODE_5040_length_725_cov_58.816568_g4677_i0.p2  ORF type:complete len:128 (-),score=2.62 NODE_5040_length_725_cov_58.816568_g4677_i0:258-641(-)
MRRVATVIAVFIVFVAEIVKANADPSTTADPGLSTFPIAASTGTTTTATTLPTRTNPIILTTTLTPDSQSVDPSFDWLIPLITMSVVVVIIAGAAALSLRWWLRATAGIGRAVPPALPMEGIPESNI